MTPHHYCCRQKLTAEMLHDANDENGMVQIAIINDSLTERPWHIFNRYPTSWHTPPGCASMLTKLCKMHLWCRRAKRFILDSNQPFFLLIMSLVSLQHTAIWIMLLPTVISSYRTKACHKTHHTEPWRAKTIPLWNACRFCNISSAFLSVLLIQQYSTHCLTFGTTRNQQVSNQMIYQQTFVQELTPFKAKWAITP